MARRTLLVVDADYMCHRAYHAIKYKLSYHGETTTVAFGVLRDVLALKDQFQANVVVFCFDGRRDMNKRKAMYPQYKANRHSDGDDGGNELREQMEKMRTQYLGEVGFRNILHADGYEADDFIAKVCFDESADEKIVISADHDLWQIMDRDMSVIWSPRDKQLITEKWLYVTYGLKPKEWPMVKALAGCNTDNVKGIDGVGEITAAKYVAGRLRPGPTRKKIESRMKEMVRVNLPLVTLPFDGTPAVKIVEDKVTVKAWKEVMNKLGMKSLEGKLK